MTLTKEAPTNSNVIAPAGRLQGKVAVITGGTRGIGLAVAQAYVREGAKVVIASRTSSELKIALGILKDMGAEATATKVDLHSEDACKALYFGTLRSYGRIDVLVNNAAVLGPLTPIGSYPGDDWAKVMQTNLNVVYWMSKAALGSMIPSNSGSIINVVSSVAKKGRANWGAYSVSKAAVVNLSEVMAEENAKYNIRVNCVNPGATRTMMRAEAMPREDPATLPSTDDVVNPFIYLATDVSRGLTGSVLDAKDWFGRQF